MNELELLFLVLALIYLWECVFWLRRGSVGFLSFWGIRWRTAHPAALMGNQTGGIVLANPLPPLGTFHTGSQSPLSISPDGVFSHVAQCINPGWRPPQTARYVRFDAIREIEASSKQVMVNGELLVRTGSPSLARHWAAQLRRLRELPLEQRAATIREIVRESFNAKAIEKRLADFQPHATRLRTCTNVLFFYLFVFLPAWISRVGFRRDWIFLLAALLLLTATASFLFNRACKTLYPDAGEERFTHWFMILFSPATAVRAGDALSRPLLETFHPLAVARVLLAKDKFLEFGRRALRELRYPCPPACPVNEPEPRATEQHARMALLEAMEHFLKDNCVDPAEIMQPPKPTDETCRSYCPRCLAQFTTPEGACGDCGGLALEPLGSVKQQAKA